MARPRKLDPTQVKTSVRLNAAEDFQLDQLCALYDPALGQKPNTVLRSLIRKEALSRGLASESPALTNPPEDLADERIDRLKLSARLLRLENYYTTTVAPHLHRTLLVPPTTDIVRRLLEASPTTRPFSPDVETLRGGQDGMYQEIGQRSLKCILEAVKQLENAWAIFKRS